MKERLIKTENNCYELILHVSETLTLEDLMELNKQGFVYHSSQTDIDFEDENESGTFLDHMDIHNFSFTDPKKLHINQMPF